MPHPYDKFGVGAENSTLELARRNAEITRNYTSIAEQAAQVLAANRRGYEGIVEQAVAAMNAARREYSIIHGEAIDAVRQARSSIADQMASIRPKTGIHATLDAIRLRQDNQSAFQSVLQMDRQLRRRSDVTRIEGFEGLMERAQTSYDLATKSILARAQELALWARNPMIGARLASIPAAYASFCESAGRQLSLASETHLKNALSGSLLLAERHLLGSIDAIAPFIPQSPGPPPLPPTVPLRLYRVQKEELEASDTLEYSDDPEELAQHSPAAISSEDVSLMLHLIHQVNETARLNGREDVFTPTNKMFEAVIELNGMVPTNKLVFGHFMDCLYWIFYRRTTSIGVLKWWWDRFWSRYLHQPS
jgi:hypothetical protein